MNKTDDTLFEKTPFPPVPESFHQRIVQTEVRLRAKSSPTGRRLPIAAAVCLLLIVTAGILWVGLAAGAHSASAAGTEKQMVFSLTDPTGNSVSALSGCRLEITELSSFHAEGKMNVRYRMRFFTEDPETLETKAEALQGWTISGRWDTHLYTFPLKAVPWERTVTEEGTVCLELTFTAPTD